MPLLALSAPERTRAISSVRSSIDRVRAFKGSRKGSTLGPGLTTTLLSLQSRHDARLRARQELDHAHGELAQRRQAPARIVQRSVDLGAGPGGLLQLLLGVQHGGRADVDEVLASAGRSHGLRPKRAGRGPVCLNHQDLHDRPGWPPGNHTHNFHATKYHRRTFRRAPMTLARTMAVTQEEIDAQKSRLALLNQMIDDGVRQVSLGDQQITYNTTDSLMRARDDARTRLQEMETQFSGRRRAPRQMQLVYAGRG